MILLAALIVAQTTAPSVKLSKVIPGLLPVAMVAAPSGTKIAVALEDGSVRIIDSKTRMTVRNLAKHPQPCYAIAWCNDGAYVATGDESARVFIEDSRTGAMYKQYRTATKGIQKLSFNSTRQLLAATGKDDTIRVYDITKPQPKEVQLILGKGANFYGGTFHPKSPFTLTTGILGSGGRQYDVSTGKVSAFITGHGGQGVFDTSFNSAGTRLVTSGRDSTAIIWDTNGYKKLGTMKGHQDWVVNSLFSPNGKFVATASTDRTVKVWNAYSLQKVAELPQETGVGSPMCFTADGTTLVTVNDAGYLQYNSITPAQPAEAVAVAKAPTKKKSARSRR